MLVRQYFSDETRAVLRTKCSLTVVVRLDGQQTLHFQRNQINQIWNREQEGERESKHYFKVVENLVQVTSTIPTSNENHFVWKMFMRNSLGWCASPSSDEVWLLILSDSSACVHHVRILDRLDHGLASLLTHCSFEYGPTRQSRSPGTVAATLDTHSVNNRLHYTFVLYQFD